MRLTSKLWKALRAMRRLDAPQRRRNFARRRSKKKEKADLELLRTNPVFDRDYYLTHYDDVAEAGLDPVKHYYRFGASEGRNPGPSFDTLFYLGSNPDVAQAGVNPLVHYIRHGEKAGRRPVPDTGPVAPRPKAPPTEVWRELVVRSAKPRTESAVDVIIPVYRGYDDTLACIHSVLTAKTKTPFELVVIDDESPEPELSQALRGLADLGLISLYVNARNRGFVATVNRGMRLHPGRDVVLLNSDTLVYGNWLDRLRQHVLKCADIATVTPFSNNATICSYPFFNRNNGSLLELADEDLDGLAACVNADRTVDIPTGVGFCLYIRRSCIDQMGIFDEERFGRGYGEENDFCLRAAENGWRNVLACDVFVRHTGEVSFANEAKNNQRQAMQAVLRRHPRYEEILSRFFAADPPRDLRRRLDVARLIRAAKGRAMLFVTHTRGGGIERHVRDLAAGLADEGVSVLTLRPVTDRPFRVALNAINEINLPNLNPLDLSDTPDELVEILSAAGVFHVHVHSFADFSMEVLALVPDIAGRLGVSYDFTVHDYLSVCPRINLIDGSGVYCGERGVHACVSCLAKNGSPFGRVDIVAWRDTYHQFLEGARMIIAPSRDTADRMKRYFPDLDFTVRPHPERLTPPRSNLAARRIDGEPLRIAVIGAIGPHKGSKVLLDCAKDAAERNLPLEFVVIGYSDKEKSLSAAPNVTVTGQYNEREVLELVRQCSCHIAFFPAISPETYSYTLSIAVLAGLYPVAFDLGAPAARIRDLGWGSILPLALIKQPQKINDALLGLDTTVRPDGPVECILREGRYPSFLEDYFALVPQGGERLASRTDRPSHSAAGESAQLPRRAARGGSRKDSREVTWDF